MAILKPKDVLIKSITLLYRQALLGSDKSSDLVRVAMETVKVPEVDIIGDSDREVLSNLKNRVLSMCAAPPDTVYEQTELLQGIRLDSAADMSVYDVIKDGISAEMSDASLKRSVISVERQLLQHNKMTQLKKIVSDASTELNFKANNIKDWKLWINTLAAQLEPFQTESGRKDPAIVDEVDVGSQDDMTRVFTKVKKQEDSTSIFTTGWQGLNRMLQGGFRRGKTVVIGALQHKFKTGFTLSLFRDFCTLNTPVLMDPNRKPLLIRISFEDEIQTNIEFLYQLFKESETGKFEKIKPDTPPEELSKYVMDRLSVNGFHVKLLRVDPSQWSYKDVFNKIVEYETQGYEVQLCMLDYLAMLPTTGCDQGAMGWDVRDLYRRTRNFMAARNILFITPHQLSTEAKALKRAGVPNFVKEIAEKGYWDKCKTVDNEVDLELYIDLEKINNETFLAIQRGKHRGMMEQLSEEHKYFCLKFNKQGAIPQDTGKPDSSRRKPGGQPLGDSTGEQRAHWDFGDDLA